MDKNVFLIAKRNTKGVISVSVNTPMIGKLNYNDTLNLHSLLDLGVDDALEVVKKNYDRTEHEVSKLTEVEYINILKDYDRMKKTLERITQTEVRPNKKGLVDVSEISNLRRTAKIALDLSTDYKPNTV